MAKRTSNDLQNTKQKLKTAKLIPIKTGGELRLFRKSSSFCSASGTRRGTLLTNPVISHEWRNGPDCDYDKWNISLVIYDKLEIYKCSRKDLLHTSFQFHQILNSRESNLSNVQIQSVNIQRC